MADTPPHTPPHMPPHTLQRRHILRAGAAIGMAMGLPTARACEFYAPNFKVIHPWTRATADGVDVALVSMVFDEVTAADVLVGVSSPVASQAQLGGAGGAAAGDTVHLAIAAGQRLALSEAGIHLRLLGLRHPLEVGRAYPMTLAFQHAGLLQTQLTVDYERFL